MEQLTIAECPAFFELKYSTAIRIWHWLTFLFITASMVTVLFASTLFEHDGGKPPDKVQHQAEQKGEEHGFDPSKLSPERRAAFTYSHQIWDAHKIIGFALCFLLLSRAFIEVRRRKEDRLITRINAALNITVHSKEEQQDKRHYVFVKRAYLIFYFLFLIMAITGLIMAFDHTAIFENVSHTARNVHSFVQYLIYAYVLAHLIGVVRADLTEQKGIVSAMINGGNSASK